jgi:stage V sporulation protein B
MCIFAGPILNLLFPNAASGTVVLQYSAFTILFTVLAQTTNGALQGLGKVTVPATALGCGVFVKLILNMILIPIQGIGVNGAAIASVVCHIISFAIGFSVLRKNIKIDFEFIKCIIKPIIATIIMAISSYYIYLKLQLIIPERISTIIALVIAIFIYATSVVILKILRKEEILMLPYGEKTYRALQKVGIYKEPRILENR